MKGKVIYFTIVVLFVFFVLQNLNEGQRLWEVTLSAKWWFVILALVLQLMRFLLTSIIYKKSLSLFGTEWNLADIIPLTLAAQAINVFTPFAPLPGSGIFVKKARTEKIPALNIAASMLFMTFIDYLALVPLLVISLFLQFTNHSVFVYEVLGIAVFLFIITGLFMVLLIGIISPGIIGSLFGMLERFVNKVHFLFKNRNFFIKDWSEAKVSQFTGLSAKLLTLKKKKRTLLGLALIRHLTDMLSLYFLFLAFGINLPLTVLFIGYSLLILFSIVSPTPQGTGFVETIIPAIFKSMSIAIGPATLAILVFRGLNIWLSAIVGYFFLHRVVNSESK